jgi:glycosyltransferase involved in cell wall biosynthesis
MRGFRNFWHTYAPARRVVRLGPLDERQKLDFFAALDVFALPSRSDSFGLVLLEAWANGVPNLAYRAGGVADVIRSDEDGLLVRCGDVEALAEALGCLVENKGLRQQLGRAGQARALRDYRWEDKLRLVQDAACGLAGPAVVTGATRS